MVGFTGCVVADGQDSALDTVRANALSANALSANALSANALSANAFGSDIVLLNQKSAGKLAATTEGRALLQYIARCALVDGTFLRAELDGQTWDFPGLLGVVPEWESEPLTAAGKELMTGCLLAHVNAFGVTVPISVRSSVMVEADASESSVFYYGDGAFYGNLHAASPEKFSCRIRANRYFDESTHSNEWATSPHASQRVCAGKHAAKDCGIEPSGYCDEVCNLVERDGSQWRFGDCLGANGQRYANAFTVWLEGERAESCETAPAGFTCNPN